MKRLFLIVGLLLLVYLRPAHAQYSLPQGSLNTTVGAVVGGLYLTISGYASPHATVNLFLEDTFARSTVADGAGNFSLSQVNIKEELSSFCLEHIDFKKLGNSKACISIPPATGPVTKSNIFLPPTIGLTQTQIKTGETVQIHGYTMPGATVILYNGDNQLITLQADYTGFYTYDFSSLNPGQYTFTATGIHNSIPSLEPTEGVTLTVVTPLEDFALTTQKTLDNIAKKIGDFGLIFVIIALLLLVSIIVLLIKLRAHWLPFFQKFFPKKALHHDWLLQFLKEYKLNE